MKKYVPLTPEDASILQTVGRKQGREFHRALAMQRDHEYASACAELSVARRPSMRARFRIRQVHERAMELYRSSIY